MQFRSPTRIDFGGGWTDVPPFCDRECGFVCNAAINRYSVATVERGAAQPTGRDDALIAAALRRSGLTDVRISVKSDFPVGAGLGGSSAASAAILGALAEWRGEAIDRCEIAEAGRRIEWKILASPAGGRIIMQRRTAAHSA